MKTKLLRSRFRAIRRAQHSDFRAQLVIFAQRPFQSILLVVDALPDDGGLAPLPQINASHQGNKGDQQQPRARIVKGKRYLEIGDA